MARASKQAAPAAVMETPEPSAVNQAAAVERRLTMPEHAHAVAEMVHKNTVQLATSLIAAGKLHQGGSIASAAEHLINEIRMAFPNA